VGKAEFGPDGSNPRFVVTNLPSSEGVVDVAYHRPRINGKQVRQLKSPGERCWPIQDPEAFYRQRYCQRCEMENRIKEQQLCLFADRTSCTSFTANQFRLMLSSFAYVLVDGLRRLFKIAARVRVTARRVIFHLASHCPFQAIFQDVKARLCCRSG